MRSRRGRERRSRSRARSSGEQAHVVRDAQPRRQGFVAETSWNRAGKLAVPAARDTTRRSSSSGWRSASSTRWENSGSSSRHEARGYGETARGPGSRSCGSAGCALNGWHTWGGGGVGASSHSQVSAEAARAPVEGSPVDGGGRFCPICGEPLRPRQRVCSSRCRAELSRRRQAEARRTRDEQVRVLLFAALALMGKNEQP
jgi:predicted nucleic acid-binding Zn ribbon protein